MTGRTRRSISRDLLEFIPRHQCPEIQLPIPQAGPLSQPPQPSVNEELMRGLQATHDFTVDMLHTQGVNPCQVYQEKDASTILANIRPQQVSCSFCNRVCKTTQKLKSHVRSHHLKTAAYKCPVCDRSCGDPYSLSQHKKTHLEASRKYLCAICCKGFESKSQVNEHTKRHQQGRVLCSPCSKSSADKKSQQDHLKICTSCPKPAEVHPQTEEQSKSH